MNKSIALHALATEPRKKKSVYPEPFAERMIGREKRILGDLFGLRNFGVNLTRIMPGGMSALRHSHKTQDEFIYVLIGRPTLVTDIGETQLEPGMCAGFAAGNGDAHHLVNRSDSEVVYLEVGDRSPGDEVIYPDDDLAGKLSEAGTWVFMHKDGTPYS
ncbi:MAG: cupin domain-containing protein [Leptospira sp.]|nr:cupin domain-containing protein [Leptospira sp.]